MALVTRTISNAGSPLTDVNGGLLASTVIRFTLVNDRSYAAGTFDVETGEPVAPGPYLATTDDDGLFSVDLWPTSRGLEQRFYLCEIAPQSDTVDFPAFKAPLADGIGTLPFLAFRLAGDTVQPWEMDAFVAHVQNTAMHSGGSANIYYQPDPPASPTDGTAWIDSDETDGLPISVNADWDATSGLSEILNKPTLGTAAAADAADFAPATHDHDADYEPSGAVAGHESAFDHTQLHAPGSDNQDLSGYSLTTHDHDADYEPSGAVAGHESAFDHSLLHAPGSDDQDLSGYSLTTHDHDADYEPSGAVAGHELAHDHTQLHTHGQGLETTDSPEFADVTVTGLTGAVIGTAPTVGEALTAIDHMLTITDYPTTALSATGWTLLSGTAADLAVLGGTSVLYQEQTGSNTEVELQFDGVEDFNKVHIHYRYYSTGANSGHTVNCQIYNVSTTSWDTVLAPIMNNSATLELVAWTTDHGYNYITADTNKRVRVRFLHVSAGAATHRLELDHCIVQHGIATGDAVTSHTGLAGRSLPDQHPISAISGLQAALNTPVAPTTYSETLAVNETTFSINGLSIADGEEYSFYLHTQIITQSAKNFGIVVYFNTGNKFSGCCAMVGPAIPGIIEANGNIQGYIYSQYSDDGLTLDLFFVGTLVLYQSNITLCGQSVNKVNSILSIFSGNGTTIETSVTSITIGSVNSTIQAGATLRLTKRY